MTLNLMKLGLQLKCPGMARYLNRLGTDRRVKRRHMGRWLGKLSRLVRGVDELTLWLF